VKSLRCSKGQTYNQSHFGSQCKVQKWAKSIGGILGGDNMTEIFPFDETLGNSTLVSSTLVSSASNVCNNNCVIVQ
jgi:hypothetical protein